MIPQQTEVVHRDASMYVPPNASAHGLDTEGPTRFEFTFHALDRRIAAIPDGPTEHKRPRWMTPLQGVGALGMIAGVIPSLLILQWEPAMWMATMARAGVLVSALGWAPQFFCDSFWIVRSLLRWRSEQTRTLDHEFREFARLQEWLGQFPVRVLEEHLRFATAAHARLISKIGFLAGGSDKLAIVPLIALVAVQAKLFENFASVPMWQVYVAIFAAITYAVAVVGHLMWLRLGLYTSILSEAVTRRSIAISQAGMESTT